MTAAATGTIEVFYSYAHEDEELRNELDKHLSLLRRRGVIAGWHDRQISAGREWMQDIDAHLNSAQIILLLISADFLASDYCYSIEMQRAQQRHEAGEARVIPVILRPVDWQYEPLLHKLQALPTDARPVTDWPVPPTHDAAFTDIARGIRRVVEELTDKSVTLHQQKYRVGRYIRGCGMSPIAVTSSSPVVKICSPSCTSGSEQLGRRRSPSHKRTPLAAWAASARRRLLSNTPIATATTTASCCGSVPHLKAY